MKKCDKNIEKLYSVHKVRIKFEFREFISTIFKQNENKGERKKTLLFF